jgi:hypothetical protein
MVSGLIGYDYGTAAVPSSPVAVDDLHLLLAATMFDDDDAAALGQAGEVLADQVEDVLDVWYGFVADHTQLVASFSGPDGQPVDRYLQQVRGRFGQWILDTCNRDYDQSWLDYQQEIGRRHTPEKKNRTDDVDSSPQVPLRYVIALIYPITSTVRPFLANKGHSDADVDRMHQAWTKSVTVQVALWSRAYVGDRDW